MLKVAETLFLEYKSGLLPKDVWEAQWRGVKHVLRSRGGRESWVNVDRDLVTVEFMRWVEEHIDGWYLLRICIALQEEE